MGSPQSRQRPRSSSQESTGTLSRARIGVPQDGHRDPGDTMDSRRPIRWTTTFKNEPTSRPPMPARIAASAMAVNLRLYLAPGVLDDPGGSEGLHAVERLRAENDVERLRTG